MTATFRTHYFDSTGEAYDASQTDYYRFAGDGGLHRIEVHDGDLLVVPSEGVYGFLYQAWPVAVSSKHGEFHGLTSEFWNDADNERYRDVWQAAWSIDQIHNYEATTEENPR